ncbi:hypothetical protein OAU25_01235 [Crocinitomicaceae bacterium]|nr:hypothetical protein [Crocinitomicaceae bacterium]
MGNLVQNGDFEGGTSTAANHFTTMYTAGTGGPWGLLSNPGEWAITTAVNLVHNNFPACTDHTTGATNFFCANGADVSNTTVWSQSVPISQNTDYIFSFWAMRVSDDPSLSDLQLLVNGSPIGPVNTTGSTCTWLQSSTIWNSGAAVSAVLSIVCQSNSGSGNDFALDDIVFAPLCISSDTVVVNVETSAQTITVSDPTCHGFLDGQIDVVNNLASEYSIDGGVTWQADSSFINLPAGNYDVCSRSALGCISELDSVAVSLHPPLNGSITSDLSICPGTSITIEDSNGRNGHTVYIYLEQWSCKYCSPCRFNCCYTSRDNELYGYNFRCVRNYAS